MTDQLPVIKDPDRDDVAARVKAAAFDTGHDCKHCDGSGVIRDGSDFIVHSRLGFIGADWSLDEILSSLAVADAVAWGPDLMGHDLAIRLSDRGWVKFDVPHPDRKDVDR